MTEECFDGEEGYISLHFARAETRAEVDDSGAGSFTEGDRIGLFIDNGETVSYRELTRTSGEWLPRLKRSEFGTGELTLAAHYPALDNAAENPRDRELALPEEQTDENASGSDLLFARTTLAVGSYRTTLTFRLALHRLRVRLDVDSGEAALRIRSLLRGRIDLLTGEAAATGDGFSWITPRRMADGSFTALIWPQPTAPYRDGEEAWLEITADGRTIRYEAPATFDGKAFEAFEPGKQTSLRLDIRAEEPAPELAGTIRWVYGVHAPDFPGKENIPSYPPYVSEFPAGAWFRYDMTYEEAQYLTWAEGCGWYDCNKSMNYDENDGNLCRAASASNMLIWWMIQNRDYIEAYDREYGSSVTSTVDGSVYERPAPDFKPLYSGGTVNRAPVFEFFKHSFYDIGSWESAGVNWFITGNDDLLSYPTIRGFHGFFSEVFSESDIIATDSPSNPDSRQFNDFIIDALLNRKAIGFSIFDINGTGTGMHAMTIWGAEFDDEGRVSHIYYCDNNSSDQDANGAVICRKKIVYAYDNSIPELGTRECTYLQGLDNEEGIEKKKNKVTRLCSVDLRRDIWAKHFPDVVAE